MIQESQLVSRNKTKDTVYSDLVSELSTSRNNRMNYTRFTQVKHRVVTIA